MSTDCGSPPTFSRHFATLSGSSSVDTTIAVVITTLELTSTCIHDGKLESLMSRGRSCAPADARRRRRAFLASRRAAKRYNREMAPGPKALDDERDLFAATTLRAALRE